ncbi:MAG: NAD(+)/NADH kinase [Hespellia sp.]|nr:NAD(+)/NADH kinase [Hespellia sp.]
MNKFYIVMNTGKDKDFAVSNELKDYIEKNGCECVLSQKDASGQIVPGTIPETADCVIVLGGDGTMIQTARELSDYDFPLLGINMGTLGYLTQIEMHHAKSALKHLFSHEPVIEKRMMLKGILNQEKKSLALNDVVISREGNLRVIHFDIYVNGSLLNSYQADGVIISTPTGSTGYNLSAGGPIVEPTASMIVLTPICSHALNTSSIVLSSEDVIEIEISEGRLGKESAAVSFDGGNSHHLTTGDRVRVQRAEETTSFVKISEESFLKTLRRKMKGN